MAEATWYDVDATTIRNCWKKAGILPTNATPSQSSSQPLITVLALLINGTTEKAAEKQVEAALDELVFTGALQKANHMNVDSLLNPPGESLVLTEVSDKEIYRAVVDVIAAHDKMDQNGHDHGDSIEEASLDPPPSRRDVAKAVATINKYIEDLNDSFARRVEALLGTFNQ